MAVEKIKKEIVVKNKLGLHARPASLFVQIANKFNSRITLEKDKEKVNGKSIMGVLMLGAEQGSSIIIEAEGSDAKEALGQLEKFIANGGEPNDKA